MAAVTLLSIFYSSFFAPGLDVEQTGSAHDVTANVTDVTLSETSLILDMASPEDGKEGTTERTAIKPRPRTRINFPTFRNGVIDYVLPTLFGLGLVCNSLSFVVILKSEIRKTSTGVYLCVLAWADCVALTSVTSTHWAYTVLGREFPLYDNRSFKQFVISFSTTLSAMCIVCVTADRFVAVWFPFQAKSLTSRKRAMVVITIVTVSLAAIFFPSLLGLSSNPTVQKNLAPFINGGALIPVNIFYSYGPLVTLLCLNIAISVKLAFPGQMVKEGTRSQMASQISKTIVTVLAVSFAFIICTVPLNVMFSLTASGVAITKDPLTLEIVYTTSRVLNLCNHSLNFFLYIFTSANFRRTLFDLFKCPCTRDVKGRIGGDESLSYVATSVTKF